MKTSRFSINGIIDARSHKRLLNRGKLLAAVLPMCLALASHSALAIDAARTVHSGADTIDSGQFLDLVSLSVPTQETSRQCVAVASSQAQNPGGIGNQIEFALFRRDGGTFVGGNVNGRCVFELSPVPYVGC